MKKAKLICTLVLLNISFACSQSENYPPIEDFEENLFILEKVVDAIVERIHIVDVCMHCL